jgi:hypothetical protein
MALNACLLLYQYRPADASDFRSFGGLLMGKIFPMSPLAARLGFVRKREKEARRADDAQRQLASLAATVEPLCPPLDKKQEGDSSPPRRRQVPRKREAKRKAEARRLKEDMAVCAAVKDLLKAIRESVALIDRIPKDEWGRMCAHDVTEDGEEVTSFEKTSYMFKRFTVDERHVLSVITRKHRAAAKRLTASIAATRGTWEATLAEYKRNEILGPSTKSGGHL